MGACSPGEGWTPTCPSEKVINSFFCFSCVCGFCFPYKTVFISTRAFSGFYPSNSLPSTADVGMKEQLCGAWLLARVKPRQLLKNSFSISCRYVKCLWKILIYHIESKKHRFKRLWHNTNTSPLCVGCTFLIFEYQNVLLFLCLPFLARLCNLTAQVQTPKVKWVLIAGKVKYNMSQNLSTKNLTVKHERYQKF